MFNGSVYYVVLVAVVALSLSVYLLNRKFKWFGGKTPAKVVEQAPVIDTVNCRIFDYIQRRVYDKVLLVSDVGHLIDRQYSRLNDRVYGLWFDYDTEPASSGELVPKYWPFKVPTKSSNFPTYVYDVIQHPEQKGLMMEWLKGDDKSLADKYGYILIWAGVIAFLILLASQS